MPRSTKKRLVKAARAEYQTDDIEIDDKAAISKSDDGHQTVTTKRKMNQASWQFALGYGVHQRKGEWFVDVWSPALTAWLGLKMPYHDGMTINPRKLRMAHNAELATA